MSHNGLIINSYLFGLTLSFVDSAVSAGSQITIPATAAIGDYAFLVDRSVDIGFNVPVTVVPSGWTSKNNITIVSGIIESSRQIVSTKKLVSGDPGLAITGMTADNDHKVLMVFRPSISITTETASTFNGQATDGNPTAQNNALGGIANPAILIATIGTTGTPAFSTPTFDGTVTQGKVMMGYFIIQTPTIDISVDANDLGNANSLQSGFVDFV